MVHSSQKIMFGDVSGILSLMFTTMLTELALKGERTSKDIVMNCVNVQQLPIVMNFLEN